VPLIRLLETRVPTLEMLLETLSRALPRVTHRRVPLPVTHSKHSRALLPVTHSKAPLLVPTPATLLLVASRPRALPLVMPTPQRLMLRRRIRR
jgi:hypothetical protein